jgi:hypothetical protein
MGASAVSMATDAANQAFIATATASGTGGATTRSAAPRAVAALDFQAAIDTGYTIDLATFTVDGVRVLDNASGTLDVDATGTVATSTPGGTVQLVEADITVVFSNVLITNRAGDTLSIPSGSYTYSFSATGSATSVGNWSIGYDATFSIPAGSPVTGTLTIGGAARSASIHGHRRVHADLTRVDSGGVNTLVANLAVRGSQPMAQDPTGLYTNWVISSGGRTVTWNRRASLGFLVNYDTNAVTLGEYSDKVFLTAPVNGQNVTVGPFSAAYAAWLLGLNGADAAAFRENL